MGSCHGEPLCHASLAPAEYRPLLGENGFEVVSHVVEEPASGGRTIWLAQLLSGLRSFYLACAASIWLAQLL
jgi:hypothetical protein